jgi:hypothetical protein
VFSKKFAKDSAERVGSTIAQTALALIVPIAIANKGLTAVPWFVVLDVSLLAGLICLLKCIIATRLNAADSASLVDLEKTK